MKEEVLSELPPKHEIIIPCPMTGGQKAMYKYVSSGYSKENLPNELETNRKFASWNNYPKYITNSIIKRIQRKQTNVNKNDEKKLHLLSIFILIMVVKKVNHS